MIIYVISVIMLPIVMFLVFSLGATLLCLGRTSKCQRLGKVLKMFVHVTEVFVNDM